MAMRHKSSAAQTLTSATRCARRIPLALAVVLLALIAAGCGNDQNEANQKLIQQQQAQIEKQQEEIEAIQASQNQAYTPGVASASRGGCDRQVEQTATERGGEKFAAGDFSKALGYYQDALTACPNDDRANVNIARTYEALHNDAQAVKYYRKAAESSGPTVTDASEEAKNALVRLQASQLP
jgi:tetratricopeptide (TPR) repeat protein